MGDGNLAKNLSHLAYRKMQSAGVSIFNFLLKILFGMFQPAWMWLTGIIAGAATGVSVGIVTGVVAFGGGLNGMYVFGPIGAVLGCSFGVIIGLIYYIVILKKRIRKAEQQITVSQI